MASRRQVTPVAMMIVRACTDVAALQVHGPRGRDRSPTAGRVTMISAPRRFACCRARRASSSPDTPGGEAEVVLDARRGLRLAPRGLALDDQRPQPLRGAVDRRGEPGRPAAEDDRVVVGPRGLVCRPRRWATSRSARPDQRRAVVAVQRWKLVRGERGPGHRDAASAESGVNQSKRIWLRSRNVRSSLQAASLRCPSSVARDLVGAVANPCSPPIRSRASAATLVSASGDFAASAWNCAGSMRMTRVGSRAR